MSKSDAPESLLPPELRFLKILVSALAGVMIVGLLAIVALLVIRFSSAPEVPRLPEAVVLPDDAKAKAVTFGTGWYAVVTDQDEILVFDAGSGEITQRVKIAP
ncbi:DUF6476 family protein [Frigidibacter sp. MR17.14]|uniref:DUF6476 family protein n=1 Tax=Frigidibacter sp. MR17.14 TaxID=3126509 RepID=UPI003012E279